jgi:hypothetical protein
VCGQVLTGTSLGHLEILGTRIPAALSSLNKGIAILTRLRAIDPGYCHFGAILTLAGAVSA